ncbi:MAG: hypothetical protein BalsKO_26030 [Balneolaceae bacterium]
MRRVFLTSVLSLLLLFVVHAQQSPQLLFDEANTLLENNEFADAMDIYHQIENGAQVSGALFLNMGVASTQIDSLGLAKYYFLKAQEFQSTRNSATEALEYVESQFSRQSATLPKLPWDKAIDWMIDGPGSLGVFFIGISLIVLAISFVLIHWFNIVFLRKLRSIISSLLSAGVLILMLAFYVDYVDHRYSEAVIITNEVQVMQKADETADLVSLGYEGYSITVDQLKSSEIQGWIYIRLGNGQFGWIENNGVKIL